jgi:hypothetical protein
MRIPENELNRFSAHGAGPAIAPSRESVLGRRPDMNVRRPPVAFMNRPVVARTAPPPAPVSFDREQAAIRANGGRPLGRAQITALEPQQAAAVNSRVRVVPPGPIRPIQNGQRFGTVRPEQSLQERERALHATPILPAPGPAAGAAGNFRNDRPPSTQMRNDQYRMQNNDESRRQAQEVRPAPQATPIAPSPQSRPFDQQPRPMDQSRAVEQSRQFSEPQRFEQSRAVAQPRPMPQATPVEPPRAVAQPRAVEQPREQFRAPEPPRPTPRPMEQPRPEAHAIEQPRAVPQPRPAAPPARVEERRAKPQDRPDPHNRQ